MKHLKTFESFINEGYVYPEGVKKTGDKILDKFAKLIHAPSATVKIMTWAVQGRNIPFMTGTETFSVEGYDNNDFYTINCKHGLFKVYKSDVKKAEDLYDEVTSLVQAGKPKRSTPTS